MTIYADITKTVPTIRLGAAGAEPPGSGQKHRKHFNGGIEFFSHSLPAPGNVRIILGCEHGEFARLHCFPG